MAENKKSFLFYVDWSETFDELSNEDAGLLIKHLCAYVQDKNPESENILIKAVFANIKNTLKRDLKKWEKTIQDKSKAGLASAEKRKQNQQVLTGVDSVEQNPTEPTVSVTVTDTVNVNDKVIVIKENIDRRKLKFASTLEFFLSVYSRDFLNDFYKYWTEPNKSNTKFRQELERTWDLSRRLETWAKNENNFKKNGNAKITKGEQLVADNIELHRLNENGEL